MPYFFGGTDFRPGQISGLEKTSSHIFANASAASDIDRAKASQAFCILATVSKVCSSVILDLHVMRVLESVRLDSTNQPVPLLVWLTNLPSLQHLLPAVVNIQAPPFAYGRRWIRTDTLGISSPILIDPFHSPPNLSGTLIHKNDPPLDLEVRQSANIKDHRQLKSTGTADLFKRDSVILLISLLTILFFHVDNDRVGHRFISLHNLKMTMCKINQCFLKHRVFLPNSAYRTAPVF